MEKLTLGIHQSTYDAVFQHPIARNLQWREVRSMLSSLAEVTEEANGNLKFVRNGQTLTVHPPRRKDFSDIQELMQIRHFLERTASPSPVAAEGGLHLLVVIDHRLARVYRTELKGAIPQSIVPLSPDRHLHNVSNDSNGQRKPEDKAFYAAIVKSLQGAEKILLLGPGTGASSAMDQLLHELEHHHKELRGRVIASVAIDEHHLSPDQLLAKARKIYATAATGAATTHRA